jgi:hypothetical protein
MIPLLRVAREVRPFANRGRRRRERRLELAGGYFLIRRHPQVFVQQPFPRRFDLNCHTAPLFDAPAARRYFGVGTGTHTHTQPFNSAKYESAQKPGVVPPADSGGRLIGFEIDPVWPPGGVPGGVGQIVGGGSGGSTIGCVGVPGAGQIPGGGPPPGGLGHTIGGIGCSTCGGGPPGAIG